MPDKWDWERRQQRESPGNNYSSEPRRECGKIKELNMGFLIGWLKGPNFLVSIIFIWYFYFFRLFMVL